MRLVKASKAYPHAKIFCLSSAQHPLKLVTEAEKKYKRKRPNVHWIARVHSVSSSLHTFLPELQKQQPEI